MQAFPHYYHVHSRATPVASVTTSGEGKPDLAVAPPREFDGPGDVWSPEELLLASLADCFILSFRAIAQASKLEWQELQCEATAQLDKVGSAVEFTAFELNGVLTLASDADEQRAERLLQKAKDSCFVSRALTVAPVLSCEIRRV